MRCVFSRKERNRTIGSVNVFLYRQNPKGWDMSAYLQSLGHGNSVSHTDSAFLLSPPFTLFSFTAEINETIPPCSF
jgi:hypothetical protein